MAATGTETLRRAMAALAITAVVGAALAADILWVGRDVCLTAVLSLVIVMAYGEFCDLCESWGTKPFRIWGIVCCLGLLWLNWLALSGILPRPMGWQLLDVGAVAAVFAVFLRQSSITENRDALPAVGMTLLGLVYLWFMMSFIARIRHLHPAGADWLLAGNWLMISTVALSKVSDIGAYFVGRHFGRHKLIPRISPAKSVEGSIAGLASSVGAAYLCSAIGILPGLAGWMVPVFGLLCGATGQCGDLLESLFKRSGGVKDSGTTFPGFGGILDVIDSLLITAPPAYFFLRFVAGLELGP